MKLTDKNTGKFIGVAFISGILTFAIACGLWYMVSRVNLLHVVQIPVTIILCWIIGALIAWLIIPDRKSYLLGIAAYLSTIGVNFIIAVFNFLNGERTLDKRMDCPVRNRLRNYLHPRSYSAEFSNNTYSQMNSKTLKKTAADIRRNVSREHGFRQSSYINFKVDGGYFFCLYFFANGSAFPNEAKLTVKPMYADTLWWEIWDAPECIDAPISLRGTGAYALSGMVLAKYENLIVPKESGDSEIKDLYEHIFSQADIEISRFISENPDADTFYPDENKMDYDPDRLLYLMALIHNGREDEALSIIKEARSNKHHCVFRSGWNSDSYTYIRRWCNQDRTAERIRHRIDNIFNAVIRFRAFVIMSMSRSRRYNLPDFWDYRPLDGGILMAIGFSWIFLMNNFTMAWISLAILIVFQFIVDGKRAERYYREFMNLPPAVRRKWTIRSWMATVVLWIYVILLIIKPL